MVRIVTEGASPLKAISVTVISYRLDQNFEIYPLSKGLSTYTLPRNKIASFTLMFLIDLV
jgi:hypothetical protein